MTILKCIIFRSQNNSIQSQLNNVTKRTKMILLLYVINVQQEYAICSTLLFQILAFDSERPPAICKIKPPAALLLSSIMNGRSCKIEPGYPAGFLSYE